MHSFLDPTQLAEARSALLGTNSEDLIKLIFHLSVGKHAEEVDKITISTALKLGWINSADHTLTQVGRLVADPIREYRFWVTRGRKLHGEDYYELLAPAAYKGKSVLEPGCGFGCNLLSLSRWNGRFVGLEPVALYRQFTPIFAEREGLTTPQIVDGKCELLPFADEEFDVVLCYSAHQYMDIRIALREIARVLRPGGQLQIIGGTIGTFINRAGKRIISNRQIRNIKDFFLTVSNTAAYEYFGKRLFVPSGAAATTAPVYPRYRFMHQWMTAAGLVVRKEAMPSIGGETCFIADKPRY